MRFVCIAHLGWMGFPFLSRRSWLGLSINIDRVLFWCSPFPGSFTPLLRTYITHPHPSPAVARRQGSGCLADSRLPISTLKSPVTTTACFLSIGAKSPYTFLGHIPLQTHINQVGCFHASVAAFWSSTYFVLFYLHKIFRLISWRWENYTITVYKICGHISSFYSFILIIFFPLCFLMSVHLVGSWLSRLGNYLVQNSSFFLSGLEYEN